MIPEPSDPNREVPVNETFHVQTDDELIEKELKQIEADDQAIQTILLGLPEEIYAVVDMLHQDQPSFNQNYMQQPMPNLEDITDLTTTMNMALALMAKAFKLNYSTPTNNNQRISSNPRNRQIAQPGMNMGQDRQLQMVGGNGGNQFRQYARQNVGNLNRNQNGLIVFLGNANPNGNGNLVAARAEADLDEIEEVNANCILMANLQQASTSAKFVGDFKSLSKEADKSLAKHTALELEIEHLLRAVVSQDIMSVVQNNSVDETSNLQTGLERTKERFENCIIKKENEYAKLWNDWVNPFKPSMEEKHVPNKVRESVRTNSITVSQPPVITKKVVNSDTNGLSSTGVENIKTKRPQPRSNTKNDRVPSVPKSSCKKNKEVDVEEH
nr:hypothetical protein [Tanacetum cinerariifolium]